MDTGFYDTLVCVYVYVYVCVYIYIYNKMLSYWIATPKFFIDI